MKNKIIIMLASLLCCISLAAKSDAKLRFHEDGTFKIVQFSDIHWKHGSPKCAETVEIIETLLEREKPDLVMLTGDIAWRSDTDQPWYDIPKIFEKAGVLFTAVLGNHDNELPGNRNDVFDNYFVKSPNFLGEKGPEGMGCGNFVLPIYQHNSDKISHLMYFFDSHNNGGEDRMKYEQVVWYRELSDKFTKQNNGTPYPSIAIYHVPNPEFKDILGDPQTIGTYRENGGVHKSNTGLFEAFYEKGDVIGIFAGHNHLNDYGGLFFGIGMFYGRVTGQEVWGIDDHGCRAIELYENQRRYNTWIHTPNVKELMFNYPTGITSIDEEELELLPGINATPKEKGIAYELYANTDPKKDVRSLPDMQHTVKVDSGVMTDFKTDGAPTDAVGGYYYDLNALLNIPKDNVYRFDVTAWTGAALYIDGQLVAHRQRKQHFANGKIKLGKGLHKLRILHYAEDPVPMYLGITMCDKESYPTPLTGDMLYVP